MKWSFSASRMFSECPRKWYYSKIVANPMAKDPLRREAHLLKQLKSLYAWRGSLVDTVIEKLIVPRIKSNNLPSEEDVTVFSTDLMNRQLEFGKQKKYRSSNSTKSSVGDEYCAFYDVEYNGGLNEDAIQEAKEEVLISLRNLLRSNLIRQVMEESSYVVAQRPLVFQFEDTTISCTPDLLVFHGNAPPKIIDWKVHAFARNDFWLQLGVYAIALSKIKPHKDFPKDMEKRLKDPTTFRLIEYQLLKNEQREHSITLEDVADIEDYIFISCTQMNDLVNGKKFKELDIEQFQTALFPNICSKCKFKKICWKKAFVQRKLFEVPWA